jgi:hypothetical protein
MYEELFNELEKVSLPVIKQKGRGSRHNFPEHRSATFGFVKERFSKKYNLSYMSRQKPYVYELLFNLGKKICRHNFTSIHVNKNLVCTKHKDKQNIGNSTIVSFGYYTGCTLMIEGVLSNTFHNPIEFNGFEKEHWNTDDLVGTKYSVIFYNIKLPEEMYPYKIAIPSYKRAKICNEQTLKTLYDNGVDKNIITVFVTEEEYDEYKSTLNPEWYGNLVIGLCGITNQRQFIVNYYAEGDCIVGLDDDIKSVDLSFTEYKSLHSFLLDAFEICKQKGSYIWSANPVYNPYFRENRKEIKEAKLNYMIGAFYGFINRYEECLQNTICDSVCEDYEKSILYYLKDGITLRFNRVGFQTKYFGSVGGLGNFKSRLEPHRIKCIELHEKYPDLCKIKVRKNLMTELVFKST